MDSYCVPLSLVILFSAELVICFLNHRGNRNKKPSGFQGRFVWEKVEKWRGKPPAADKAPPYDYWFLFRIRVLKLMHRAITNPQSKLLDRNNIHSTISGRCLLIKGDQMR